MTSLLFGQSSVGCSVHLQVDPVHHRVHKPIITKDADEEKDPSSRQSRRKVPYKKVAHGSTSSKTGGLVCNRRTELKTLDATISVSFLLLLILLYLMQ